MKSDNELVQEWLASHPVKRVPMRRPRSSQVQLSGRQQRGIRKVYSEILRDHRKAEENETSSSNQAVETELPEVAADR